MKSLVKLGAVLILIGTAFAQQPPGPITTSQLNLPLLSPTSPVPSAVVSLTGNPGPQTIYYWLVANYPVGSSSPAGPFVARSAPNTLSGSNYETIFTTYPAGVASLDVLKTYSPTPPTGACACAVATAVTSGAINDQSNSTGAYTVNPFNVSTLGLSIANEVVGLGVSHPIIRQNGVFLVDLAGAGSGTITGVTAGAGLTGGGVSGAVTLALAACPLGQTQVSTGGSYSCGSITGATLQTNSVNNAGQSSLNLINSSAFNGLTATFTNTTGGTVQLGFSGQLGNGGIANPSVTLNGQAVSLGGTGNIPFQSNSVNNTSLVGLNFINSTVNSVGLTATFSNPGTNQEKLEITGGSYMGNASTATNISTTGGNGTFWGVTGGVQGWATPSGSGTINAGSQYVYAYYPNSGSNTVVGPSTSLSADASGNLYESASLAVKGPNPYVDVTNNGIVADVKVTHNANVSASTATIASGTVNFAATDCQSGTGCTGTVNKIIATNGGGPTGTYTFPAPTGTTGGNLSTNLTYRFQYTDIIDTGSLGATGDTINGTTLATAEASLAIGSNTAMTLGTPSASVTGATGWRFYMIGPDGAGASSGEEVLQIPGQIGFGSVLTGGTGCVTGGSITIGAPNQAGGVQAVAHTNCSGAAISAVVLDNAGSGYTANPTATPAAGTGTVSLTVGFLCGSQSAKNFRDNACDLTAGATMNSVNMVGPLVPAFAFWRTVLNQFNSVTSMGIADAIPNSITGGGNFLEWGTDNTSAWTTLTASLSCPQVNTVTSTSSCSVLFPGVGGPKTPTGRYGFLNGLPLTIAGMHVRGTGRGSFPNGGTAEWDGPRASAQIVEFGDSYGVLVGGQAISASVAGVQVTDLAVDDPLVGAGWGGYFVGAQQGLSINCTHIELENPTATNFVGGYAFLYTNTQQNTLSDPWGHGAIGFRFSDNVSATNITKGQFAGALNTSGMGWGTWISNNPTVTLQNFGAIVFDGTQWRDFYQGFRRLTDSSYNKFIANKMENVTLTGGASCGSTTACYGTSLLIEGITAARCVSNYDLGSYSARNVNYLSETSPVAGGTNCSFSDVATDVTIISNSGNLCAQSPCNLNDATQDLRMGNNSRTAGLASVQAGGQTFGPDLLSGASPAISCSNGNIHIYRSLATAATPTLTTSQCQDGQEITVEVQENGTGGFTWTWPAQFQNATAINTSANAYTTEIFHWDATNSVAVRDGGTGGFTNPMTTLGDTIYGGASGVATRLAGPTAVNNVPQTLNSTPSSGAAVAPVWAPAGVPTNAQTGTTYTYVATDRASYVSFSNASAIAIALPQPNSTGFASNWVNVSCDIGAGTATITPSSSNISYTTGGAYTSAASSMALTTGQCAWIYSDNTNYFAIVRAGNGTVTSIATTSPITGGTITTTGTIACATCVTSAASLTSGAIMTGAGSQASQTNTTGTGVVTALGVNTGSAGAFVVNGGALGTPSSGTLTNATGLPINGVVSATGAIATIANGNNPLTINCALTSGTTCLTTGETTAATTAGAVEHQITTLTTTTAIPLQITQGAAGPANAAAPNIISVSAAAAGGAAGASNAGSTGAGIALLTGAGSAGGATTGVGGAGGAFTMTEGAGGTAGGTATNNGGNGGGVAWTTGAGGNGGTGAATAGSGGSVTFTLGAPGTNSATGTAGAVGQFQITGNAPASTANATGVNAGTTFNVAGVAGGASSNAAGTAGIGSVVAVNSGTGGAGTGTNAVGGAGGALNFTAGNGGASAGTGVNSNGGSLVFTPGAAGTGGSGTAGLAGVFKVAGANAGFVGLTQGSANTTANTNIAANTIIDQAPAAVTAYAQTRPGTAATGVRMGVNASAVVQEAWSGSFGAVSATAQTASISTATVCAATANTACGQAGVYRISYNVYGSGTACSSVTAGAVVFTLTWTDANGTTHTTIPWQMYDQKSAASNVTGTFNFNTALGTEGAMGSMIIATNGTIIQYASTYTACTTGTGTYNVKITTEQLQ